MDWNYTSSPVLLVGFTSDGRIRYRCTDLPHCKDNDEDVLPFDFTDRNWITCKKSLKAKGNELNKWRDKKIRRIRPTAISGSVSFMNGETPTLVSASKHHILIRNDFGLAGTNHILNSDYMNIEDWELVE